MEITDKIKDEVMDHLTCQASKDGKTMTVTIHNTGQPKPQTAVYDKK